MCASDSTCGCDLQVRWTEEQGLLDTLKHEVYLLELSLYQLYVIILPHTLHGNGADKNTMY